MSCDAIILTALGTLLTLLLLGAVLIISTSGTSIVLDLSFTGCF